MINLDSFFLYFFLIASLVCFFLSVKLAFKFKKTKQFTSLLIISLSFLLDALANFIYLFKYLIFTNVGMIPYPGIQDYMWIASYLFFGLGAMMYAFLIKRLINKKKAITDAYLILGFSILALIVSYPLLDILGALSDLVFDPLYFAIPFFASIACIPLYYLFKCGKISKSWRNFTLGGFSYMIGELLFLLKDWTYNYSFADILYFVAYLLFIKALYDLLIDRKCI